MKLNTSACGLCKPHKRYKKSNTKARALLRKEIFLEALQISKGTWKKKDHPWETENFIRSLRESS